jgi:hypothetical protein
VVLEEEVLVILQVAPEPELPVKAITAVKALEQTLLPVAAEVQMEQVEMSQEALQEQAVPQEQIHGPAVVEV